MKIVRGIAPVVCILALACAAGGTPSQPECGLGVEMAEARLEARDHPLVLVACPVQQDLTVGDPIWVKVIVGNVADSTVRLRPSSFVLGTWLDARMTGPHGEVLERVSQIDADPGPEVFLRPGGMVGALIDLRCSFAAEPERGVPCVGPYELETPGEYVVAMTFTYVCGSRCEPPLRSVGNLKAAEFRLVLR